MGYKYTITPTTLEQSAKFAQIYGSLSALPKDMRWLKKLDRIVLEKSALAAVSIDKRLASKEAADKEEFENYLHELERIKIDSIHPGEIDYRFINEIHAGIMGMKDIGGEKFRVKAKILPKAFWENGVYKTIDLEVKTRPNEIEKKLKTFLNWLNGRFGVENPVILPAICHYRLVEIHPFTDGNGRLSKLFERYVLEYKGFPLQYLLPLEDYYLRHRDMYYDLLEKTISSNDLTEWLEFYSGSLLESINDTAAILYSISGGTVDILNNEYIPLTDREEEMVEIIGELGQASGAEIAKKLGVSRQNINTLLKRLHEKGVLKKIGRLTSSRYKLARV